MSTQFQIKVYCVGILALLSGCATMSEEECRSATRDTWVSVGFDDGSHGRSENNIRNHQKACAGITSPDLTAYQEGHARGVKQYCVENTGYRMALRGQGKNRICGAEQFPGYHYGYDIGVVIYRSEQNIKQLTADLQNASQELADAEYEIKLVEAELVSPGLSTRQRMELLAEAKQLNDEFYRYSEPVAQLEERLDAAITGHNSELLQNEFEQRRPLEMPVIKVDIKPDPQPLGNRHSRRGIKPESFIIDKNSRSVRYSKPNALLKSRATHPVDERDNQRLDKADERYLDKGYYHMFRFPNAGLMKVNWSGYQDGKGDVELYYWNGRKFESARAEKRRRGYVFEVDLPKQEEYLYILVGGAKKRIFTDFVSAKPR